MYTLFNTSHICIIYIPDDCLTELQIDLMNSIHYDYNASIILKHNATISLFNIAKPIKSHLLPKNGKLQKKRNYRNQLKYMHANKLFLLQKKIKVLFNFILDLLHL